MVKDNNNKNNNNNSSNYLVFGRWLQTKIPTIPAYSSKKGQASLICLLNSQFSETYENVHLEISKFEIVSVFLTWSELADFFETVPTA